MNNKNYKMTIEHRKKLSEVLKGRNFGYKFPKGYKGNLGKKQTEETKIKRGLYKKGEESSHWKGGWKNKLPKCSKCGTMLVNKNATICKLCRKKAKPNCLNCKKTLVNRSAKYCKPCAQKGNRSNNWQGGLTSVSHCCIKCNKKISRNSWYYGSKKCVSCANKGENNPMFGKMFGENNPNWMGGVSFEEYGKEFDNVLKESIRFRDKYKCQICGCSQLENRRQLDVHHIDYDKKKNILDNLIALCRSCHLKTSYNRSYWIAYFIAKSQHIFYIAGITLN